MVLTMNYAEYQGEQKIAYYYTKYKMIELRIDTSLESN